MSSLREPPFLTVMPAAAAGHPTQEQLQDHLKRIHLLRPGLHVHADDRVDTHDFTAQGEIDQGLRIVVLLEGAVDVSYGRHRVRLHSAATTPRSQPARTVWPTHALLVSVGEQDHFERRARRGCYARRLSVGMDRTWLDQLTDGQSWRVLESFCGRHLAMHQWQPSPRVAAMAEQIVHAPTLSAPLLKLYLESRVLELVSEALASLDSGADASPPPGAAGLRPHEHQRIRDLYAFLQTERACDLSLDELARQAGTNATTLQKQFRAVYGTTVFDFLRERRLQCARAALERDGVTVGQAAELAGYSSAANFATAYRKRFGTPPKLARSRL